MSSQTVNDRTTDQHHRAPGRPFFDPKGLEHLAGFLAAETRNGHRSTPNDDIGWLRQAVQGGRLQPPTSMQGRGAWTTIAELEESVAAAGDLLGPAVRAAIANSYERDGISEDRFGALRRDVQGLDREADRIAGDLAAAEEELARLEHELARAQVHYDEERAKGRQLEDLLVDARHSAAWSATFAEQLVSALERHVPDATKRAAILRESRRKAHRTATHYFAPDSEGDCRRCGNAGDDVAHVDREDHQ